jgi:hypothetical protein
MIAMLLWLHGRNPSQTRSSPFLAGYPVSPASTVMFCDVFLMFMFYTCDVLWFFYVYVLYMWCSMNVFCDVNYVFYNFHVVYIDALWCILWCSYNIHVIFYDVLCDVHVVYIWCSCFSFFHLLFLFKLFTYFFTYLALLFMFTFLFLLF